MLNLNDREWKAFFICDIFSLESTSSGIDGNKLSKEQGDIPYLTRTDLNNGYKSFVGQQVEKYKRDSGNCITIGLDTQTAFYQPHSFYTGQNIQVLKNENLNKYNAKFFIPLLHNAMVSLNWGGNGATLGRLKKKKIVVPITDEGIPDYVFMEQYIREREDKLKRKYIDLVNVEFGTLPISLAEKEWKEFSIADIFVIKSGKRLTTADMDSGNLPFIGATELNNGVTNWINTPNETLDHNVLGVNYNGSVAEAFYHPYSCVFSDDVKRLHLKNAADGKYILLFLGMLIRKQKVKYTYGYKFNGNRMERQKILLPITYDGQPDYEYMKQYAKAVMFRKCKKYLEYQNCRTP